MTVVQGSQPEPNDSPKEAASQHPALQPDKDGLSAPLTMPNDVRYRTAQGFTIEDIDAHFALARSSYFSCPKEFYYRRNLLGYESLAGSRIGYRDRNNWDLHEMLRMEIIAGNSQELSGKEWAILHVTDGSHLFRLYPQVFKSDENTGRSEKASQETYDNPKSKQPQLRYLLHDDLQPEIPLGIGLCHAFTRVSSGDLPEALEIALRRSEAPDEIYDVFTVSELFRGAKIAELLVALLDTLSVTDREDQYRWSVRRVVRDDQSSPASAFFCYHQELIFRARDFTDLAIRLYGFHALCYCASLFSRSLSDQSREYLQSRGWTESQTPHTQEGVETDQPEGSFCWHYAPELGSSIINDDSSSVLDDSLIREGYIRQSDSAIFDVVCETEDASQAESPPTVESSTSIPGQPPPRESHQVSAPVEHADETATESGESIELAHSTSPTKNVTDSDIGHRQSRTRDNIYRFFSHAEDAPLTAAQRQFLSDVPYSWWVYPELVEALQGDVQVYILGLVSPSTFAVDPACYPAPLRHACDRLLAGAELACDERDAAIDSFHNDLADILVERLIQLSPYTELEIFSNVEKLHRTIRNKIFEIVSDSSINPLEWIARFVAVKRQKGRQSN